MSGGVDSSVTAALLLHEGYDVTGVYMKNWSQDLPGFTCPWEVDYQDAKRVAVQLGIGFKMYDFQLQYRERVVDYLLEGYKAGITPNPDIMCNQEIKFKLFLETALEDGADLIATGHYARINYKAPEPTVWPAGRAQLLAGIDTNKDQSYFLYRVTQDALAHTLMPIGGYAKPQVREMAKKFGLATAEKKDSQGICFVGKVGIKEFLQHFVVAEAGAIVDQSGKEIGRHDGALFYTIGQRHGLDVGGGLPYYVTGKSMDRNEVYVTNDLGDAQLWSDGFTLTSAHWINTVPAAGNKCRVRTRYRAPLVECTLIYVNDTWKVQMRDEVRALTPGQSAVFYDAERVIGGGIVI